MIARAVDSEHFTLHKLADGVHAAIAVPGKGALSNSGLVDLGDDTVVFDSFTTPAAARDLRKAAVRLTGREPSIVVISHHHSDHWLGNQVFSGRTSIWSTTRNRELMIEDMNGWLGETIKDPRVLEQDLVNLDEQIASASGPRLRQALENALATRRLVVDALLEVDLRPPDQTFDTTLTIEGTVRSAEFHIVEHGHTESDVYMLLPAERVAFLGDLAFFESHPFMPDSDPNQWVAFLEKAEAFRVDAFVPGHGRLGTADDVKAVKEYIKSLRRLAAGVVAKGGTADDAVALPLPPPFDSWVDGRGRFELNMRFLFDKLSPGS